MKKNTQRLAIILASILTIGVMSYLYGMGIDETISDATENTIQNAWQRKNLNSRNNIQVNFQGKTLDVPLQEYTTIDDLEDMLEDHFKINDNDFELYDAQGNKLDEDQKLKKVSGPITMKLK